MEVSTAEPCKYWTRMGIAEWLVERMAEDVPTLVCIDPGFSFAILSFCPIGRAPLAICSATGRPMRITLPPDCEVEAAE
ncbi:hypothetical protein NKJ51_23865 [Mesorhizobium sp. M0134]|uniref:hypothetical protein n=1 Tax=Mesorhizobium sp. M0134 TaxID=2956889 RepID=UPI0033390738